MKTIPIQSGSSFPLRKGEKLKITSLNGDEVGCLVSFNARNIKEKLASGITFEMERTIKLSSGNYLWSNRGNKMMKILEDTPANNDFMLGLPGKGILEIKSSSPEENSKFPQRIYKSLEGFSIQPDDLPTPFTMFLEVRTDQDGNIETVRPKSKSGDYIIFEAQMNLIVGLGACPVEICHKEDADSIKYEILEA